jgi:hypothetical protein
LQRRWLATTVLLLLPAGAIAEQFEYGVRTQGGWTDNVYGTSEEATVLDEGRTVGQDPVDDWSVRVSPWGKVSDLDGEFTWSLEYRPAYEYYLQESDIRGFDHEAGGRLDWRVGERTTLVASETFRRYRSLLRFNENAGSLTDPAVLRGEREKLTGTQSLLGVRHSLTRRDELWLNLSYNTRDYESASDLDSVIVGGGWRHSLDQRTLIGLQASWIQQSFSRRVGDDAVTDYYNLSAVLEHQFSRTLRFEAYAGPALIDSNTELVSFSPRYGVVSGLGGQPHAVDAGTCPLLNDALPHQPDPNAANYNPHVASLGFGGCSILPPRPLQPGELNRLGYPRGDPLAPGSVGGSAKLTGFDSPYEFDTNGNLVAVDDSDFDELDVTYFARVALIKDWERWHAEVSYERSSDDSGTIGASSVEDSVELSLRWEPARLWTVTATGGYSLLDQASDAAIPSLLIVENGPVPAGVDSVSEIATVQRLVVDVDDNALSYTSAYASLAASRKLSERSSVFAALYWYEQEQNVDVDESISFIPGVTGDETDVSHWENLTFWVGFDWHFDTIKF